MRLAWRPASLDHVFGDARLRDFQPELEQFAMDARRSPKRVLDAHPPDQHTEVFLDLRAPSPRTRFPTPEAAKAGPMPPHERLELHDGEDPQDRRKPSIQLDQEPAIAIREPDPTTNLTPQNNQLMSECRILCLKPALGEWQGRDDQNEAAQCKHCPPTLGDSVSQSNPDLVFGTHSRYCTWLLPVPTTTTER